MNRLHELKKYTSSNNVGPLENTAPEPESLIVEMELDPISQKIQNFHNQCRGVEERIEQIKSDMSSLQKAHTKSLTVTSAKEIQEVKSAITGYVNRINIKFKSTKETLSTMQKQTHEMRVENFEGDAYLRIREQQVPELIKLLQEFQDMQESFKHDQKDKMVRTIQVVNDQVSDDQAGDIVDRAMEQNIDPQVLIKRELRLTSSQVHTLDTYMEEVQQTHTEIIQLERGMREIHQMFVDFSTILAEQDEMLDRIDYNVETATDYVEKGTQNMTDSIQIGKKNRKLMFCIIAILVVAGCVGGLILLIFLKTML
ncbi:t-SNARE family protein [Acrasis kona]|uniref:t-SNARE family protein n=1 Tax=Acrasis kona TaxID=1008807 RepID=A0AAW2YVH3_9EUKA